MPEHTTNVLRSTTEHSVILCIIIPKKENLCVVNKSEMS